MPTTNPAGTQPTLTSPTTGPGAGARADAATTGAPAGHPTGVTTIATDVATDVATPPRPAVAPPAPWDAPAPRHVTTGSGDGCGPAVMVHHLPGQHVATVQVHLGIDLRAEPDGADGIATVLAATMEHGSNAGGGAAEFADRVAACGIDWSTDTDHTGPRITCHLPATELGPALALITEAIGDPALRPADIAAQTQLLCGRILQTSVDAAARARRELPGVVFDPATRAGRPADGTLDTLQQLTPHAVTDFHRTHAAATAASSVVTIAGDLSGIDIDADIDRHLTDNVLRPWNTSPTSCDTTNADTTNAETPHTGTGDGTGQDAACDAWPTARLRPDPAAVFIEQPGAPQTYLMLAAPTIGRGHQDWPALAVAAYILGAPITGRLDAALREDKGFSYGIHAGQTDLLPGHGAFLAHGAVDADATVVALADLQNIMRSAHDGGFTDAECTAARNGICASLPLLYENAALVAAQTTQLAAHGLPHDFITQTLTTINNLTAQDINDAFRCHFDPSRLSMIAIGDPAQRQPLGEHLAADLRVLPA